MSVTFAHEKLEHGFRGPSPCAAGFKTAEALADGILGCLERGDDATFRSFASKPGLAEMEGAKFSCAKPKGMVCEFKVLHTEARYVPWDDIYDGLSVIAGVCHKPGDKSSATYATYIYKLGQNRDTGDWFVRGVEKTGCEMEYDFIQSWEERNHVRKGNQAI